ncbi:galactokinase [Salinimonas marina]|uniref:Galactokinase n=1 Tax=Salinimonas marina TaxID=2785918 RepID=A0A7S9HDD6_9ALTE|nr:galactokinase [Salinimonas marina]QPG05827.1 galactokinase [Salinimonas marina]
MLNNHDLQKAFLTHFSIEPAHLVHAPGRVNLIGEHTDYNEGFVFPAAINFGTWIAATPRSDRQVVAVAMDIGASENTFRLDDIRFDEQDGWANYVRGVVKMLQQAHPHIGGMNLMITGNVPQGAGLSSSASFEIAILRAFSEAYGLSLEGVQAALLGQQAENDFVGCSCGIMDQLISALGREDQAMLLDCESLTFRHTPLPEELAIVIINSNVKRGLVDSEYNTRRAQCEQAASTLKVKSLRHASLAGLEQSRSEMSDNVYRRARHVITENSRTQTMFTALQAADIAKVSEAMAQSHASMRDDFEITVPQIDYLVDIIAGVIGDKGGVRMTGGGFGGCVVALIPKNMVEKVSDTVNNFYHNQTGLTPTIYVCSAVRGAFA